MSIIFFIFALGFIIFIHELGHFYVAKKCGVKVEEFSIGFPPRIFKWRRNQTVYSLGLIPFGGFVKLEGELLEENGFRIAPPGKKFLIASAGIIGNIILAYLIFSFALLTIGLPSPFHQKVQVVKIFPNSLGATFFEKGDFILSAESNGQIVMFDSPSKFLQFIRNNLDKQVTFEILRKEKSIKISLKLPKNFDKTKGALGIMITGYGRERATFPQNFILAFKYVWFTIRDVILSLSYVVLKIFGQVDVPVQVVGPIGIYQVFADLYSFDFSLAINFFAVISIYLALINFAPFPGLDGFQLTLAILEKIRGKRLKLQLEKAIVLGGLAVLFTILTIVTFNDLFNLIKK